MNRPLPSPQISLRRLLHHGVTLPAVCLGLLAGVVPHEAWAQRQVRPLVDDYALKLGVAQSTSFINVTRNLDGAQTSLVTSDSSPYASLDTPPWFLGRSWFSLGVAVSYAQFTASKQEFPDGSRKGLASHAEVETYSITPALSLYLGRYSPRQYLRLSAGAGLGWANVTGQAEFGNQPGLQPPDKLHSPEGASPSISQAIEYRYRALSVAYTLGGPLIKGARNTYQLGTNSLIIALVIRL